MLFYDLFIIIFYSACYLIDFGVFINKEVKKKER